MTTKEKATFKGKYYSIDNAINEPKPIQKPYPPLWVCGGGEKVTLKLLAKYGDYGNWDVDHEGFEKKSNILKVINEFKGLKFRQQIIFSDKKKIIINDSKSTNYHSLIAALKKYKDIFLICGGQIKSRTINILDDSLGNIKKVIIIGEESNTFHKYFQSKVTTVYVHSLDKAVVEMSKFMKTNNDFNTFLFSPGAASFDQYNNFEERGRHFNKLISKLNK